MHPILLCMAFGTLFGAGLAIATEQAVPAPRPSSHLARFQDQFRAADADGDGGLSKMEAERAKMGHVVESFDRLDGDRNGRLTPAELRALLRSRISS
ncbi:MAG TPA: hypothetical protein VIM12_08375 [Noviherbaspirillum sp.]|jgi:Ca2+-binding EF-hand superfamily protein|uniref:hypothetical protein n=1 Tax=Noviherbaspirillum sp. TaxID=1926288 RepID=UPI002F938E7F